MKTIHPAGPMSESAIRQLALVHGWDGGGAFNLVAFARALLAVEGERAERCIALEGYGERSPLVQRIRRMLGVKP